MERPSTILGGLPVIVDIHFGKDADTPNGAGEYWSEVEAIYWRRKDGTKGKPIPQHLFDKAEVYDPYFCTIAERVSDELAYESWLDKHGGVEPEPSKLEML